MTNATFPDNQIPIVEESLWLEELRRRCAETSQAKVSKLLGYSAAVINQVLKGVYKGDLKKVEAKVRGEFLGETVGCPVLGELSKSKCIQYQSTNHRLNWIEVRLFKSCPTCSYNKKNQQEAQA